MLNFAAMAFHDVMGCANRNAVYGGKVVGPQTSPDLTPVDGKGPSVGWRFQARGSTRTIRVERFLEPGVFGGDSRRVFHMSKPEVTSPKSVETQ